MITREKSTWKIKKRGKKRNKYGRKYHIVLFFVLFSHARAFLFLSFFGFIHFHLAFANQRWDGMLVSFPSPSFFASKHCALPKSNENRSAERQKKKNATTLPKGREGATRPDAFLLRTYIFVFFFFLKTAFLRWRLAAFNDALQQRLP